MDYNTWRDLKNCSWNKLGDRIVDSSEKLKIGILSVVPYAPDDVTKLLITEGTMNRFVNLSQLFANNLKKEGINELFDNNDCDDAYKLNLWILLGSLTEFALQLFLTVYLEDYHDSKWKQWGDIEKSEVSKPIFETLNELVENKVINNEQKKSLKEAISNKINEHVKEHKVQKIMLDELIQFYENEKILDKDELAYLRKIQKYRNGIHSFEKREIGTWRELMECVKFWCCLLENLNYRLPDISCIG